MPQQEPIDPSLIPKFTDLDSADDKVVEIFTGRYPRMRGMVVDRQMDNENNLVHYRVTVVTRENEILEFKTTVPTFTVRPINKEDA